jgi:RNA polymerase sigma-70 factor (ECF subfamily)
VSATRAAVRLKRQSDRFPIAEAVDRRPDVPTIGPETLFMRREYGPAFQDAIRDAIATLPERQRALLRSYYVDGLTIDELAVRDGIHRATAARRVQAAREAILAQVRLRAAERLGITADEVDSLLPVVASRLELSFRHFEEGKATL